MPTRTRFREHARSVNSWRSSSTRTMALQRMTAPHREAMVGHAADRRTRAVAAADPPRRVTPHTWVQNEPGRCHPISDFQATVLRADAQHEASRSSCRTPRERPQGHRPLDSLVEQREQPMPLKHATRSVGREVCRSRERLPGAVAAVIRWSSRPLVRGEAAARSRCCFCRDVLDRREAHEI